MQCMKHMPDFEAKVAQKFLDNSNLNQSVILALVYLMQYPKIYTQTFSHLNNIVSRCSSSQVSTILKLMHDI